MIKRLIVIMLLGATVVACKKEPLPSLPAETSPYYSVHGYMNGEYVDLNVGEEGVLISQGVTMNNGVQSYYGQIVSPSEDLLMKIEFTRPETPLTAQGLEALNEGNANFLVHQAGCKSLGFGANLTQGNFVLVKNEDGDFEPANELTFDQFGVQDVTMKFTDISQNSFQIPVTYGYDDQELNSSFNTTGVSDTVYFSAVETELSHEWYIDDVLVSSAHEFGEVLPIGIHKIQHKIRDENLNESSHTTLVRITDYVLDWQMSMDPCIGTNGSSNFGNVTITILTNSQEYKSDKAIDNLSKSFTISDVKYVGNSSQVPVRAVFDLAFETILVNKDNTDSLSLTGMTGTFNVGLQ